MLKKLLHYDLKWCFKVVVIYYALGLIFSITGRLLEFAPDTTFFNTIIGICKGTGLSLVITGVVNCIIRVWVRMIYNMYKDESYLTHTLPINIKKHFLSKFLSAIITVCVSIVVTLISVIIMYLNKDNLEILKQSFNILSDSMNGSITLLIILMVMTVLLEVIFIIMVGFIGIVIGYSSNNKKLLKSVLIGLGAFYVCNSITVVGLLLSTVVSKDMYNILFIPNTPIEYSFVCIIMALASIIYIVYIIILYILSAKYLQKGINID